jgi:hypothetical protein
MTCHDPNRWTNPDTGKCEHAEHDPSPASRYLTKAEYSAAKSRLTRAENKVKKATTREARRAALNGVINEVDATFRSWADKAWPDNWHRWNIAREDAITNKLYLPIWQEPKAN